MNNIETAVAEHYSDGGLLARILAGLEAAGADLNRLQLDDLAAVEEFHIGGRDATLKAVEQMGLSAGQRVLDIGCGIGGAARYIAAQTGCSVAGIDLTPEYIAVAKTLAEMTGLGDKVDLEVASALDMPFPTASFDAALTLHVAMNIHDRAALYQEIARVLKPGAVLYIFDVMKKSEAPLTFPLPWSASAATSHLVTPEEMLDYLSQAGFDISASEDRTAFALDFFRQSMAAAANGPPALGVHLMMGASAGEKFANVMVNIERGCIVPVQMLARRRHD